MKTEVFRRFDKFDPNCCFSIYHGDHVESLDLVSTNGEEARTWITGLKYLMAGIRDEDSLAKRQRTRDQYPFNWHHCTRTTMQSNESIIVTLHVTCQIIKIWLTKSIYVWCFDVKVKYFLTCCCKWLRQTFSEADKNGDGNLSIGEVLQLLHKLNVNLPKQKVKEMFEVHLKQLMT